MLPLRVWSDREDEEELIILIPVEKDRQVDQGEIIVWRLAEAVDSEVTQTVPEVEATKPLGVVALGELSHGLG